LGRNNPHLHRTPASWRNVRRQSKLNPRYSFPMRELFLLGFIPLYCSLAHL
jgi:hypothetical protein